MACADHPDDATRDHKITSKHVHSSPPPPPHNASPNSSNFAKLSQRDIDLQVPQPPNQRLAIHDIIAGANTRNTTAIMINMDGTKIRIDAVALASSAFTLRSMRIIED